MRLSYIPRILTFEILGAALPWNVLVLSHGFSWSIFGLKLTGKCVFPMPFIPATAVKVYQPTGSHKKSNVKASFEVLLLQENFFELIRALQNWRLFSKS